MVRSACVRPLEGIGAGRTERNRSGRRSEWRSYLHALVAQLDRASDFESEGREFESLRARHFNQ